MLEELLCLATTRIEQYIKMKKTIITLILFVILPIVIATPSFYVEQNQDYDLKISCFDNNNDFCTVSTVCTLTVILPNSTVIVNNKNMTYNPSFYNYTIKSSNLTLLGEYQVIISCTGTTSGFQTFSFEVTEDGNVAKIESNINIESDVNTVFFVIVALVIFSFVFLGIGIFVENAVFYFASAVLFIIAGLILMVVDISGLASNFRIGIGLVLVLVGAFITFIAFKGEE